MKRIIFILIALALLQTSAIGQSINSSFGFFYSYSGLGSNIGSMQPTIKIIGTELTYTYEQNSYYGEKTKKPDTICILNISQSSIDSLLSLVNNLKDSTIYEVNPCIMSGGIHHMTIVTNSDTTHFTMHNTFHKTALEISKIINHYLPEDKIIWATEQDIIDCENCWSAMRKRWEKQKKNE